MGSRGTALKTKLGKITRQQWGTHESESEDRDVAAYKKKHEQFIKSKLTTDESGAMAFYSFHGDVIMNTMLRNNTMSIDKTRKLIIKRKGYDPYDQDEYERAVKSISLIKGAMKKSKSIADKHITLTRGTGLDEFRVNSFDELKKLKGKVGRTEGFYSTTTDKQPPSWSVKGVIVHISKPKGIAGVHMESVSHFENEHETLLNHGQSYYINDVKVKGTVAHVYSTMLD